MDFHEKLSVPNPVKRANPISRHFFMWVFPLFRKGYRSDLQVDDLYDPRESDVSSTLGDKLERAWFQELKKFHEKPGSQPKLLRALWKCFGNYYAAIFTLYFIAECILRVAQPLFIRELVRSFAEDSDVGQGGQYGLAAGVIISTFFITMTFHPSFHCAFIVAMRCRVACSSIIYRKALRLSKASQGKTTVGQLVNILSNDVNRFEPNLLFIPYFVMGPIQLVILTYFLWEEFGVSSLAGLGVVLVISIVQYWNGKLSTTYRRKIAAKTDERGRTMNEIIVAIRVIKMYAWEKPFGQIINRLRKLEISAIKKRSYLRGIYLSIFSSAQKLLPFLTFLLSTLLSDEVLTADKVFFTVAVYNAIIQNMMYFIPSAASGIGEIMVSLKRLETFLLLEEKGVNSSKNYEQIDQIVATPLGTDRGESPSAGPRVSLHSATASWTGDKNHLDQIQLDVSGDQVVVVVGPVGSGKTTLLHAILGELPIQKGSCGIQGRIAYAGQEPWIFAASVRQNILFGRPFSQEKYDRVTTAAALLDDFKQLTHGDQTLVGDRGVSLSGGQKARVNLARCLYQDADIYLMDDPLSAVDARVSRHLFEKCLKQFLKGKLRILVTHQLQYLSQADHIVVFKEGKIDAQGSYEELVENGIDFVSLLAADDEDSKNRKASVVKTDEEKEEKPKDSKKQENIGETMAKGALGSEVYWQYFKTGNSPITLFFLLITCVTAQVAISATEFWMSFWTNAESEQREFAQTNVGTHTNYLGESTYLAVYGGLVVLVLVLNFTRAIGWFRYSALISVNMHNKMFGSIVRSPTQFYDVNPPGRVMNRFTKDLGQMDELLPPVFFETTIIALQMIGVLAIVVYANWVIAIPAVIVFSVLWIIRQYYVPTARAIKRIEGMSKSPVFTHAAATFQGLTTIRSAHVEKILIQQFDGFQDTHTSAWYLFLVTIRCFGVWVEMIAVLFLAVIAFSFLVFQNSTPSGNVGLAITSAMNLTTWVQFMLRQSAEVENLMTSVERTLEYVSLPSEASLDSKPDKKPPSDWPKNGEITFKSVHLSYNDTPVLRNLNFEIKAKEKIGIVGRTGAGKSTIIQALFRMVEPTGSILIDGVNICDIGLHDLRKNISIIPQDPVLFCGTMRYNLDPFDNFKDEDLWRVLEEVGLKDSVPQLTFQVSDGGDNFSVGQKQLVCLARAILRNNKIIIMDEATANVDPITDNWIQEKIRSNFADCSIITIAHRLNSVMDCDRILVLDRGVIMEYDHPWTLLKNEEGVLSSLVKTTGKVNSGLLRVAAESSYNKRFRN